MSDYNTSRLKDLYAFNDILYLKEITKETNNHGKKFILLETVCKVHCGLPIRLNYGGRKDWRVFNHSVLRPQIP